MWGSRTARAGRGRVVERHRVLLREREIAQERHHADHRDAGPPPQVVRRGGEEADVAAELVEHVAAHATPIGRRQQGHGAEQAREHTAAVDVAHQQHRGAGHAGHPHVRQIATHEVGLGGAPGALDDDDVRLARQPLVAAPHCGPEGRGETIVAARVALAPGAPKEHHLAARLPARLEQDGVHLHAGLHPGGLRLHHLRPAHLAAPGGHVGVEGHVLRLERDHAQPATGEQPAEAGDQHGLARVRAGALQHERAGATASRHSMSAGPSRRTRPMMARASAAAQRATRSPRSIASGPGGGPSPNR